VSRLSLARSPAHIRRALHRNVYMVTTMARSKRLYCNTLARPPARIAVVGSTWKDAAGCERPPRARRRLHGRCDAAESLEMCCGGGWSRVVVVCRSVVRLQLQLRLIGGRRCVGGPANGSLRNNHGTCLSNENSHNADNSWKVVMPPVTSHAWRQSVCLTPTHSGSQRLRNIDGKCRTAAPRTCN